MRLGPNSRVWTLNRISGVSEKRLGDADEFYVTQQEALRADAERQEAAAFRREREADEERGLAAKARAEAMALDRAEHAVTT